MSAAKVALVAVLSLGGLAAAAMPTLAQSHHGPAAVPWLALPAVAPAPPVPPAAVPPGTPLCRATALAGARGPDAGLTGEIVASLLEVWNPSPHPCQLTGLPQVQLDGVLGAPLPLVLDPAWGSLLGPTRSAASVLLAPLESGPHSLGAVGPGEAVVDLFWSPQALGRACPQTPPVATSAVLSIGRQLLVIPVPTGPDRDASPVAPCQGRIGVGPFRATAQPTPAPAAPALLRASLRVPRRARAGSILRYQVVLGNPGRAPVDLASACSSYSEAAVSLPSRGHPRGYKALRSYELNCAQGSRIPPGGQRVFAMDLRTTRSRGALRLRLTWSFEPAQSLALTPTSALTATLELEPTRKR